MTTESAVQRGTRPTGGKSLWPTRKWIVTQVTALAALLIAWVQAGDWNKTLAVAVIGLVAQMIVGYVIPNADTPGGVPLTK